MVSRQHVLVWDSFHAMPGMKKPSMYKCWASIYPSD